MKRSACWCGAKMFFHITLEKNIILEARHMGNKMREVLVNKLKNEVRDHNRALRAIPLHEFGKKQKTMGLEGKKKGEGNPKATKCQRARCLVSLSWGKHGRTHSRRFNHLDGRVHPPDIPFREFSTPRVAVLLFSSPLCIRSPPNTSFQLHASPAIVGLSS